MIQNKLFTKLLLVAAMLGVGSVSAWADDWTTVWSADFASAPSGMTYSVTNGSTSIANGYINYQQGGGSGDRAINTAFTDTKFAVSSNWKMEFDWNCGSSNTNTSYVTFATNKGTAFTLTWAKYAGGVVVTDASANELTTSLPLLGYKQTTCSSWSHFTITGNTENGIYLTITNGATTYVNNVLVTSTFGYPATFNGSLGKAVSSMFIDNVSFATPKVAGFVATPTGTITAPDGTARKFTLSCLTDGATIYYAESDIEIGASGWTEYTDETTTSAATIYAYATDGVNNSAKANFATGAGTAITLNAPTITLSGVADNAGFYYPIVAIASNQSNLELVPASSSLAYEFDDAPISSSNPYTFTGTGTLKVTVSATGFTSNSATYVVNNRFLKTKIIDLAALTAGDLSARWTGGTDTKLPHDNWQANISGSEFPLYTYDYRSDDASNTDVINGLVVGVSSKDSDPGVTPTFYVGAGMILPTKKLNKSDLSESGTWNSNIGISVAGATADEIAVYTYPTNYGSSTATKAIAGNNTYSLYRYSDMLTKVEVYSPVPATVTKSISDVGWATYCSPYALDLANATGGLNDAFIVEGGSGGVLTKTSVKGGTVPANTGLLLKGKEGLGIEITIPVVANSTTNVLANKFVGVTADTPIDAEAGYVLMNDATNGLAFYQNTNAFTVGANTAYLPANFAGSGARAFFLLFDDNMQTTAIEKVEAAKAINGTVYNLNGQRVANPTKGLYIVNGKKIAIR